MTSQNEKLSDGQWLFIAALIALAVIAGGLKILGWIFHLVRPYL